MKYLMLIHQNFTAEDYAELPPEQQQEIWAAYRALEETPGVTPGLRLEPPAAATTVRVDDGRTLVTDGPFAEMKEAIAGWLIYEGSDLDAAIELAGRIPAARMGGAIEIRPVVEG